MFAAFAGVGDVGGGISSDDFGDPPPPPPPPHPPDLGPVPQLSQGSFVPTAMSDRYLSSSNSCSNIAMYAVRICQIPDLN